MNPQTQFRIGELSGVLGLEQKIQRIERSIGCRLGHRVQVDSEANRYVQIPVVRELGLIQPLVQARLALHGEEIVARHDDVVAAVAHQQLPLQNIIAVEIVVSDGDARFGLERGQSTFIDVVGPVVEIDGLLTAGVAATAAGGCDEDEQ